MGLFWQKMGFRTGPRLYVVVFAVDDVLWPVIYRRWQFIDVNIDRGGCWGPSDAESWFRAETYNIRILNVLPVFAESVFLMTRRVFAESVFCWVSFAESDRQFIDVDIDRGGCWEPSDAESWFRAETYNIRVLNVSPVFSGVSVFDDKARFCRVSFAESDRQFIDVDIDRDGCWGTAWRWVMIQSGNVLNVSPVFAESVFADKARHWHSNNTSRQ